MLYACCGVASTKFGRHTCHFVLERTSTKEPFARSLSEAWPEWRIAAEVVPPAPFTTVPCTTSPSTGRPRAKMATPNTACPSFFDRPSSSSRTRGRALLAGLKELHLQSRPHHYVQAPSTSTPSTSTSSRPSSRPTSAISSASTSTSTASSHRAATGAPPPTPRTRSRDDSGVSLQLLEEVARHVSPSETIAQVTQTLLAPAARQAASRSFLAIPGLVHARFVGPPDVIVAYNPDATPFHTLVQLLKLHTARHEQADRPAPRYWLDCFTGMHQAVGGPLAPEYQAQRVKAAREAAAHQAQGALLLLDYNASALKMAWPLQDLLWVIKLQGPQALDVLPFGQATIKTLIPELKACAKDLNIQLCQVPGNPAQQWQERQKLGAALQTHSISLEAFAAWIKQALLDVVKRIEAELRGMDWETYNAVTAPPPDVQSKVFLSSGQH